MKKKNEQKKQQKKQQKRKFYLEISQDFLKACEDKAQTTMMRGGINSLADLLLLFISGVKLPPKAIKFLKNHTKVKEIK